MLTSENPSGRCNKNHLNILEMTLDGAKMSQNEPNATLLRPGLYSMRTFGWRSSRKLSRPGHFPSSELSGTITSV